MSYRIVEGGMADRFLKDRNKIQVIGGGFGNGKSAALCMKALEIAKNYPGSSGLLARETLAKLNDTLLKEFFKWCPKAWIKSFTKNENRPIVELTNGSTINFRYIMQQGKSEDSTTSNLLSATYDWAGIDQVEDPGITYKDFMDLLGRLRGSTRLAAGVNEGLEATVRWPDTGPRWLILTSNPTRNWFYRKVVKPLHDEKMGVPNKDAIVGKDGKSLVSLFEAPTYENRHNLAEDFIATLEATYKGQMKDRFLLGKWVAYEGLVYPDFDFASHVVEHGKMVEKLEEVKGGWLRPSWLEAYDHGIAVPSCYLLGFSDEEGNVHVLDGVYQAGGNTDELSAMIQEVRDRYGVGEDQWIKADPSIFRRSGAITNRTVGATIAEHMKMKMEPANNDVLNGITKVSRYLSVHKYRKNPYTGLVGSPAMFFSSKLEFLFDEIGDYYWKRNVNGDEVDKPVDKNDHAMDALKYMVSREAEPAVLVRRRIVKPPEYMVGWGERDVVENVRNVRHG